MGENSFVGRFVGKCEKIAVVPLVGLSVVSAVGVNPLPQ